MTITAQAIEDLIDQHETIREAIDTCLARADSFDAGRVPPDELLRCVGRLRVLLEAHNQYEEQVVGSALADLDLDGDTLDSLVTSQASEHAELTARLVPTTTQMLREVVSHLEAHMHAEERRFLAIRSAQLVRRQSA